MGDAVDVDWATQTPAKFFATVTSEFLSCYLEDLRPAEVDPEILLRDLLDASNDAIRQANTVRGGTFKALPFLTALTSAQVKQVEERLGLSIDRGIVVSITASPHSRGLDLAPENQSGGTGGTAIKAEDIVHTLITEFELFRGHDGQAYTVAKEPGALRIGRRVSDMAGAMRRLYVERHGAVLTNEALNNALATVTALAEGKPVKRVMLRSSDEGDRIVVDLGRASGELVAITADGWDIISVDDALDGPDTVWTRTAATQPLPIPQRGGTMELLGDVQSFAPDSPIRMLQWGWVVASYCDDIPRPILWWTGPHGAGKTYRARCVLNLVDPARVLSSPPGGNDRDDNVRAASRYVVTADNIGTKVSEALSNWLCRGVTGFLDEKRTLYTDGDLHIAEIKRAMMVTSIVMPTGLGSDVTERTLHLQLEAMDPTQRRTERELDARFEKVAPLILGAVFDDLAGVLRHRSAVRAAVASGDVALERMADYHEVQHALDAHRGTLGAPDGFAAHFAGSINVAMVDKAMDDPVIRAILAVVPNPTEEWGGTASALYREIAPGRPENDREGWPTSPTSLGGILSRQEVSLRKVGVKVQRMRKKVLGKNDRWLVLTNVSTLTDVEEPVDDAAQKALFAEARYQADGLTAHVIQMNKGQLNHGRASVLDNGTGGYYIQISDHADPTLWDASAQTYNGSLARPWSQVSAKFRSGPRL